MAAPSLSRPLASRWPGSLASPSRSPRASLAAGDTGACQRFSAGQVVAVVISMASADSDAMLRAVVHARLVNRS